MRLSLLSTTALGALLVLSSAALAQQTGGQAAGGQSGGFIAWPDSEDDDDDNTIGRAQQLLDNRYQVSGQEVNPNVAVQDRPRPDYDPLGIRAGTFLLFPSIDTSISFDSNVNATEDDEDSDIILGVTPEINATSTWSRHQLNASAYIDGGKYLSEDQNDFLDFGLGVGGRYDVSRAGSFRAQASYDRLHESKDDPDRVVFGDSEIAEYDRYVARGGYQHRFNRITLAGDLLYRLYDYDSFEVDGQTVDQSVRNNQQYGGNLRVGYALSPRIGVFTQANYLFYDYDNETSGGRDQDSEKYGLSVGTSLDFTSILFGEASIGYQKQEYKSDAFENQDGLSADVALTWNVTTLSTLQLIGSRDFLPSSSGGTSRLSTDVALVGHHELLRNLILNAQLVYENEDYEQTTLERDIYTAGFGADYLLTRNFSAGAEYEFRTQDSTSEGGDYDKHVVMLRLRAQM
ncbi:MAG TPA: outer membrane beta-barrel protein [Geminicoccus sp.]|jgi:hypothetical protein|uniref:outer membrane beta-barrel protein n=1 Tax=Geminicoccus sp. TaxID=2024832 RepID=UPI002E3456E7|nr:outer membrane beta-barrel protein [Geminicoccus sp.]HEX2524954.1 outer membrane beta-barrel protein [Geminicoccus sp.]